MFFNTIRPLNAAAAFEPDAFLTDPYREEQNIAKE